LSALEEGVWEVSEGRNGLRDVSERREERGGEGCTVLRGYILTGTVHSRLIWMIFLRGWKFGSFDK
jgi:hypothetical protein